MHIEQQRVSRETKRKLRHIEAVFGLNWRDRLSATSIDAAYRKAVADCREALYVRISPRAKLNLCTLAEASGATVSQIVEGLAKSARI